MPQVLLQPAARVSARRHYRDTILNPVPLDRLRRFLPPDEMAAVERQATDGAVRVWGIAPSDDGKNEEKYERLRAGATVFFGGRGYLVGVGRVGVKLENQALAEDLWHPKADEKPRTLVYLVEGFERANLRKEEVNTVIGHKPNDAWQRVNLLDDQTSAAALAWWEGREGTPIETKEPGPTDWRLTVGQQIRRVDLHEMYGGPRQERISPSSSTPNVLVFTDSSVGEKHDRWEGSIFRYCGAGQRGDQTSITGTGRS